MIPLFSIAKPSAGKISPLKRERLVPVVETHMRLVWLGIFCMFLVGYEKKKDLMICGN